MVQKIKTALTILRRKQVEVKIGLSRSTIYDRINPKSPQFDPTFPKPIRLGAKAGAIGFIEGEIDAWIDSRIKASRVAALAETETVNRIDPHTRSTVTATGSDGICESPVQIGGKAV